MGYGFHEVGRIGKVDGRCRHAEPNVGAAGTSVNARTTGRTGWLGRPLLTRDRVDLLALYTHCLKSAPIV